MKASTLAGLGFLGLSLAVAVSGLRVANGTDPGHSLGWNLRHAKVGLYETKARLSGGDLHRSVTTYPERSIYTVSGHYTLHTSVPCAVLGSASNGACPQPVLELPLAFVLAASLVLGVQGVWLLEQRRSRPSR